MRAAYFLFLPAWFFLALSIYQGIEVQRSYVAYLVADRAKISDRIGPIAQNMNNATQSQIKWLEFGLCVLRYGSSTTLGGGCFLTKPEREDTEGDRNENFSAWVGDLHRGYWLWEANNPKG